MLLISSSGSRGFYFVLSVGILSYSQAARRKAPAFRKSSLLPFLQGSFACGRVPFVARQKEPKTCRGSAGSRWTCPCCASPSKVHIPALPPVPHRRSNHLLWRTVDSAQKTRAFVRGFWEISVSPSFVLGCGVEFESPGGEGEAELRRKFFAYFLSRKYGAQKTRTFVRGF